MARWVAAGVRHAVLLRVLPVVQHDLATPVSVLRMTALVLKRKLADTSVDVDYCIERAGAFDQQCDALMRVSQRLSGWGVAAESGLITRPVLVEQCVSLLRPLLELSGVTVEIDPALDRIAADASSRRLGAAPALRYLLLASICHLHDSTANLVRIAIAPDGDDALRLSVLTGAGNTFASPDDADANADGERIRIDAAALLHLAFDLERSVRLTESGIWLRLEPDQERSADPGIAIE